MLIVLLLAGLAVAAFLVLRDEGPPAYSPLEIEGDPYAYERREDEFEKRAAAGHSHVVYAKSPGGVLATARRVAAFRDDIERAADDAGVDPDLIEGMVLLESAGRAGRARERRPRGRRRAHADPRRDGHEPARHARGRAARASGSPDGSRRRADRARPIASGQSGAGWTSASTRRRRSRPRGAT